MDRRRWRERVSAASPQPTLSTPSHLLCDVSNLKTPRPCSKNPNPNLTSPSPLFFTASKKTPYSSYSTPVASTSNSTFRNRNSTATAPASRSKAAQRLKALELEQSRSARKAHVRREKALGSLSRSLTAWINFLLQNPKACGCKVGSSAVDYEQSGSSSKGKRRSLDGEAIYIFGKLRSPKRQRAAADSDVNLSLMKPAVSLLEKSLCNVCSLEDMRERMMFHMSRKSCNEVLLIMSQVCKNIDEGRLRMKLNCPLVNDLAVREKAVKALMCYNPLWLRIGLHILFGGDSLLLTNEDQDGHFLKEFIEKHLLTHVGIARKYALNKLVGGIYMPGYYEALGSVILKRFLLLAIALDRTKCESSLSIKHGIDSIDGGSPLLFTRDSPIKSSRQVIKEFLIDSMHGEGDLLAHLVLLRCKVDYEQSPLCEYDFKVKNIFEDFRDGILLCRMVQLLLCSETILSKVRSPSDTPKKNLQNCSTAILYLKDSGVEMSDSDGVMVTAADLANGDKELTCSILWNVFVHLQVPLLINKALLLKEIVKIKGSDMELSEYNAINEMDLLLHWIQAVCATQNVKIDSFSSLDGGRALTCLIKYYFGNDIHHSFLEKEKGDECNDDRIMRFFCHSPALLDIAYIQNVTAMLGNSPKALNPCDICVEDACSDERSTEILLIFYASRLISADKLDIMDSFRSSQQAYHSPVLKESSISQLNLEGFSTRHPNPGNNVQESFCPHKKEGLDRYSSKERSAIFIQARLRGFIKRTSFLKMKRSTILLQSVVRAWLAVRFGSISEYRTVTCSSLSSKNGIYDSYLMFMIERQRFRRTVKSVVLIQQHVRAWIRRKGDNLKFTNSKMNTSEISGVIVRQSVNTEGSRTLDLQWMAATRIQKSWKGFLQNMHSKRSCAAIKIQSQWRCLSIRKYFICQVEAIKTIQSTFQSVINQKDFQKKHIAAIEMQSFIRGHLVRTKLLGASKIRFSRVHQRSYNAINDAFMSNFELRILVGSVVKLQSWWKRVLLHRSRTHAAISYQSFIRGWIVRRDAAKRKQSISTIQTAWRNMLQNRVHKSSMLVIQACIRSWIVRRTTTHKKCCILKIQRWWRNILLLKKRKISMLIIQTHVRGWIARKKAAQIKHDIVLIQRWWRNILLLKKRKISVLIIQTHVRGWIARKKTAQIKHDIVIIQRWWRNILPLKKKKICVLIIQTHVRGWIARKKAAQIKHDIVIIQSCWKGFLVRKHCRPQLLNLRHRMKLSAVNVSDEMRLINRLVVAISELLGYRSISNIRHICTTMDTATELSQKCCETLVDAGAIGILLKQIQLLNRGIPDQEVLKRVLSTLRNIGRYKHLSLVLVNTPRSVEIIFQEMLRNKSEGFVISCQLLRRMCAIPEGLETARKLRGHAKRLKNVIVKFERKVNIHGRKSQINNQKDLTERKLREANSLMSLLYK